MLRPIPINQPRSYPHTVLGVSAVVLAIIAMTHLMTPWFAWRAAVRDQFFHRDPGMEAIQGAHLAQRLDLEQTVQGVTMTLHHIYADEHRLVIGLTTRHPAHGYRAEVLEVRTRDGENLLRQTDYSTAGAQFTHPRDQAYGAVFTVWFLDRTQARKTLVPAEAGREPPPRLHIQVTAEAVVEPSTVDEDATIVSPIAPFVFDVRVPMLPADRVPVQHTEQAAGSMVTLDDLEVAPSSTRVRLCFDPPDQDQTWRVEGEVMTSAGTRYPFNGGRLTDRPGCMITHVYGLPRTTSGPWTVRVTELKGRTTIRGPWTFPVTIP